jgi:hypothetical protein
LKKNINIEQVNDSRKGYYFIKENGKETAKLSYSWAGNDKIIIEHTMVNPDYEGKGLGKKLVLEAVKMAREKNIKIIPLCSFSKHVFDKDKNLSDVLS